MDITLGYTSRQGLISQRKLEFTTTASVSYLLIRLRRGNQTVHPGVDGSSIQSARSAKI